MDDLLKEQLDAGREVREWGRKINACTVAVVFACVAFFVNKYLLHGAEWFLTAIFVFQSVFFGIGIYAFIQGRKQVRRFWRAHNKYKIKQEEK